MKNQIGQLQDQMPVANQQAAQQAEAARQIQQQRQIQQLSAGQIMMGGGSAAQQMGAQAAQQAGAVQSQLAQQAAQQSLVDADRARQQNELMEKQNEAIKRNMLERKRMDQEASLNRLGRDIKRKLSDDRRSFEQTARGEKFTNIRQLADYMIQYTQNEETWKSQAQAIQQASQQKIALMEQAYNVFAREESQLVQSGEAELNRESVARVRAKKEEMARRLQEAKKKAGYTKKLMGGVTFVAGAVITAVAAVGSVWTGGASLAAAGAGTSLMKSGAETYQKGESQGG